MYKPSSLAYPPIVAGTPASYPLTSPMGGYMTPAAGYAPQYIPFHAPHRAYGSVTEFAESVPSVVYGVIAVAGAALARGPLKKVIAGTATSTDVLTFAGAALVGGFAASRIWKSNA
jgi:hypothetical protein